MPSKIALVPGDFPYLHMHGIDENPSAAILTDKRQEILKKK